MEARTATMMSEKHRKARAACEKLSASGEPFTIAGLAGLLKCKPRTATVYLYELRAMGMAPWKVARKLPARCDPARFEALDRKALALAAEIAGREGSVSPFEVARIVGRPWYAGRAARLRKAGLWTWPALPQRAREATPAAEIVAILEESRRGLVDARMERDETRPGVAAMPIREVSPPQTNEDAVRKIVREWKLRTGRVKASPEAQRDRLHMQHPMAPREARVYRFSTSHVHASRYDG